jgi:hypothetical protein
MQIADQSVNQLISRNCSSIYPSALNHQQHRRGVTEHVFKTLAKLASSLFRIFTRQVRKQLAKNVERIRAKEKKTLARLSGEFVCIFTRQS